MRAWLPNIITLINLFFGCAAVILLLNAQFIPAIWCLLGGLMADFLDGMVARWLGVSNPVGKELDSLADMVTFGLAPGMIYYVLLYFRGSMPPEWPTTFAWSWWAAPAFLVTLFSAVRLANFNLDDRQTDDFIGLATPSSTLYAAGLLLIVATNANDWAVWVLNPLVLYGSIALMSYLLVAEVRMFSFKFKQWGWVGNELRFIFAALAVLLLLFLQQAALPFIVIIYLLLNLGAAVFSTTTGQ
ncbi:MAG: CDP-alcohol phosphatidyltransferase family protein [Bacteroidota bacterium]